MVASTCIGMGPTDTAPWRRRRPSSPCPRRTRRRTVPRWCWTGEHRAPTPNCLLKTFARVCFFGPKRFYLGPSRVVTSRGTRRRKGRGGGLPRGLGCRVVWSNNFMSFQDVVVAQDIANRGCTLLLLLSPRSHPATRFDFRPAPRLGTSAARPGRRRSVRLWHIGHPPCPAMPAMPTMPASRSRHYHHPNHPAHPSVHQVHQSQSSHVHPTIHPARPSVPPIDRRPPAAWTPPRLRS